MAQRVTILGAGNAGHALAFDISRSGGEVMMFEHPKFAKSLEGIRQRGGIEAVKFLQVGGKETPAAVSGFAKIAGLTTDPKEAMEFSETAYLVVPGFAQEPIFSLVMPDLRDGHTLVMLPGNFASLTFKRIMKDAGVDKKVTLVEATSIPYAVRVIGPGQIYMLGKKTAFSLGVLPAAQTAATLNRLKGALLLDLIPLKNVLEAGLSNGNMIIHVPTATLNMGLAESTGGKGQFYRDGVSPTVAKVVEKMDQERLAIGKAYGLKLMSFVEIVNSFYSLDMKSIRDFVVRTPYHNNVPNDFPASPKDRYISEDCPYELVPVRDLGKLAGVPCPTIEAIIWIDSVYNDVDYFREGRTLAKLGIEGMSREQILRHVQ